jgi:signal recognition particle receptor subunit beta
MIWVVDASDHTRFAEGRDALKDTLDAEDVPRGTPLLVLANKQDLPGALNVTELARELELRDIHGRPWHIMVCCVSYNIFAGPKKR